MRLLKRLWQRTVILCLGILSVWLIVFVVFRFTDHRLPWVIAIAVTYGIAAYMILPWVIRIGLKVLKRQHVPEYTITGDGLAGDPVNLALIGTLPQLRAAFTTLGWTEADSLGFWSSWRMVRAFLFNKPYPNAPFSTLYLFGRGQDVGFQKPIDNSPRKRHHVRFWSLSLDKLEGTLGTASFWLNTDRPPDDVPVLWIGAATRDTGISLTWLTFQITHATDSDTDAERDLIISELQAKALIGEVTAYNESKNLPSKRVNHYIFDGDVSIASLNGEHPAAGSA
ncbi:LssY C-terminal domain-containing protein [Aestuariivirga sp.]|uniref:LssY C-terminal domain-containing protein n=1 Tax=Aestuariivirga sp. TaxID=2650926 RepID=UPI003BAA8155